jgi:hypothetical protein
MFISLLNLSNILIVSLDKIYNPLPFVVYDIAKPSYFPVGRFLSLFVFIFIFFAKRYYFALAWPLLCLVPFLSEFVLAFIFIRHNMDFVSSTPALGILLMIANPLDYLSTFLKIILSVWLVAIVIRFFTVKNDDD